MKPEAIYANYLSSVRTWDKKHRIIGKTPLEELIAESHEAITTLPPEIVSRRTMVDIGAGAGILGFAWLQNAVDKKCVFVEPKEKSVAFLKSFYSYYFPQRVLVIGDKVENVARETIESFDPSFFCASRAFSGADSLEKVYLSSELRNDALFAFFSQRKVAKSKKFAFNRVVRGN